MIYMHTHNWYTFLTFSLICCVNLFLKLNSSYFQNYKKAVKLLIKLIYKWKCLKIKPSCFHYKHCTDNESNSWKKNNQEIVRASSTLQYSSLNENGNPFLHDEYLLTLVINYLYPAYKLRKNLAMSWQRAKRWKGKRQRVKPYIINLRLNDTYPTADNLSCFKMVVMSWSRCSIRRFAY